jgi:peptide/nickel transport system substrate-binding protein
VRSRTFRVAGAALALVLLAAACGDDDDDPAGGDTTASAAPGTTAAATTAAGATTSAGASTTAAAAEPTPGGAATVLLTSESGSLDPVNFTASGGSDGQYAFALYGALLQYDLTNDELIPLLAESFEGNADFSVWTLKLRDGLVFSDGTPFDAAAVKVNWDRVSDPTKRSPGLGVAATIASSTVVDARTLEVTLKAPNAAFPYGMIRTGLNYIASAAAIQSGHDLVNNAIGAGPFVQKQWTRDGQLELERNPNWFDAPRPYLDELTFRIVPDEQQRADAFATGNGDIFYTSVPGSVTTALDEVDGAYHPGVIVPTSRAFLFNVAQPPFNDPRVREAVVRGVDLQAALDVAIPGLKPATSFTPEDAPWYTPNAQLPEYDPAEAQRLIDEVAAETGADVTFGLLVVAGNTSLVRLAEFVQTSLDPLEHLTVEIEAFDNPTLITRVLQKDFQMTSWGFPTMDPDSGIYIAVVTGSAGNYSGYSNPAVDTAFNTARATDDPAERAELFGTVYEELAKDLPWFPYAHPDNGFVASGEVLGGAVVWDGILRTDLLSRAG